DGSGQQPRQVEDANAGKRRCAAVCLVALRGATRRRTRGIRGQPDGGGTRIARAAFVWFNRNAASFLAIPGSGPASIATAKKPALAAPASPIANVATGIPFGICTIERSESSPRRYFEGTGTPSTGTVVFAASTPARCAAPPAPAMMQRSPRGSASSAY